MDPDMNKYELEHVVTGHAKMTRGGVAAALSLGLGRFYTDEHLETIMRRAHATGINIRSLMPVLMWFSSAMKIENLHPLQWGIFRVKHRKDRRPGLPIESPLSFYASYAAETARKATKLARRWLHLKSIVAKIEADPHAKPYQDDALIPVTEEDAEHMELYTQSETVRAAVKHERRVAAAGDLSSAERSCRQWPRREWAEGNGLGDAEHQRCRPSRSRPRAAAGHRPAGGLSQSDSCNIAPNGGGAPTSPRGRYGSL